MNEKEEKFDLSMLSLEDLLKVYNETEEFISFLESSKINLEKDDLNE